MIDFWFGADWMLLRAFVFVAAFAGALWYTRKKGWKWWERLAFAGTFGAMWLGPMFCAVG